MIVFFLLSFFPVSFPVFDEIKKTTIFTQASSKYLNQWLGVIPGNELMALLCTLVYFFHKIGHNRELMSPWHSPVFVILSKICGGKAQDQKSTYCMLSGLGLISQRVCCLKAHVSSRSCQVCVLNGGHCCDRSGRLYTRYHIIISVKFKVSKLVGKAL